MALIPCPECNYNKISDKVGTICPKCGYIHTQERIDEENEKLKNMPIWKQYLQATLGFVIIVISSLFLIGITDSKEVKYIMAFLILGLAWKSWITLKYANMGVKIYFVCILSTYSLVLFFLD